MSLVKDRRSRATKPTFDAQFKGLSPEDQALYQKLEVDVLHAKERTSWHCRAVCLAILSPDERLSWPYRRHYNRSSIVIDVNDERQRAQLGRLVGLLRLNTTLGLISTELAFKEVELESEEMRRTGVITLTFL